MLTLRKKQFKELEERFTVLMVYVDEVNLPQKKWYDLNNEFQTSKQILQETAESLQAADTFFEVSFQQVRLIFGCNLNRTKMKNIVVV